MITCLGVHGLAAMRALQLKRHLWKYLREMLHGHCTVRAMTTERSTVESDEGYLSVSSALLPFCSI